MPSVPVLISDAFEGAFPSHVAWQDFTLRFAEADISSGAKNLTAELLSVAADVARLGALQRSLQAHAADVLWEAPVKRRRIPTRDLTEPPCQFQ